MIPDIRNKLPFDPFEPKAPADLIADIQDYLSDKTPAAARVEVRNPHYTTVKLRFGVRFRTSGNEGFYRERLIEEVNRFLSPWAYEDVANIVIGGRIYANSIVNFVDQREYVDYVARIRMFRSEDGVAFEPVGSDDTGDAYVTSGRPDGVLVAARRHEIDVIVEAGEEAISAQGINYMKVELDLEVG